MQHGMDNFIFCLEWFLKLEIDGALRHYRIVIASSLYVIALPRQVSESLPAGGVA